MVLILLLIVKGHLNISSSTARSASALRTRDAPLRTAWRDKFLTFMSWHLPLWQFLTSLHFNVCDSYDCHVAQSLTCDLRRHQHVNQPGEVKIPPSSFNYKVKKTVMLTVWTPIVHIWLGITFVLMQILMGSVNVERVNSTKLQKMYICHPCVVVKSCMHSFHPHCTEKIMFMRAVDCVICGVWTNTVVCR